MKMYVCLAETAPHDPNRNAPTKAETFLDAISTSLAAKLENSGMGQAAGVAKVTATFGAENGRTDRFSLIGDDPLAESLVRGMLEEADAAETGQFAVAAVFDISDIMVAESFAWDAIYAAGAQDDAVLYFWQDEHTPTDVDEAYKSIEVYYDIDAIPETYKDPLEFRNAAMELVEQALQAASAGEWSGAEIGMGKVNFGFEVADFDHAEAIIRAAVKDTPFEAISEITRFSYPEDVVVC